MIRKLEQLSRKEQMWWLISLSALTAVAQYVVQGALASGHSPATFYPAFWYVDFALWGLRAIIEAWAIVYLFSTVARNGWQNILLIVFEVALIALITLTLETTNWTNDTTRATALALQDGVLVKSGATTRRYLGTGRTTSVNGETEDSAANRFLWNYYNRVARNLYRTYANSHTYNTAAYRAFDNAQTSVQATCVIGVAEILFEIKCNEQLEYAAGNSIPVAGCGVNTASSTSVPGMILAIIGMLDVWAQGNVYAAAGYNFICPVEYSTASGTAPAFNTSSVHVTYLG